MKSRRDVLWTIVDALLLCGVTGMLVTVLLQVVTRFVGESVPWTEELTRNLFVLTVFMGLAVGFRRVEHARMTFLVALLPKSLQSVQVHLCFAGGLVFFVILMHQGTRMVLQQFRSGEMSPASGLPMFLVSLPIPLGALLAIVGQFQSIYLDRNTRRKLLQEDEVGFVDGEEFPSEEAAPNDGVVR